MKVVGVLLLLTGLTVTLTLRFNLVMGNAAATEEETTLREKLNEEVAPVQWAPAIGSVLIVAGAASVIVGRRKKKIVRQTALKARARRLERSDRKVKELQMNNPSRIFYARKDSVH